MKTMHGRSIIVYDNRPRQAQQRASTFHGHPPCIRHNNLIFRAQTISEYNLYY